MTALCRQKLDEVNRSKESELADLRQHMSTIEQQLANSNIVSSAHYFSWVSRLSYNPCCKHRLKYLHEVFFLLIKTLCYFGVFVFVFSCAAEPSRQALLDSEWKLLQGICGYVKSHVVLFRKTVIVRLPNWMRSHRNSLRDWSCVNKNWWTMLKTCAHSFRWQTHCLCSDYDVVYWVLTYWLWLTLKTCLTAFVDTFVHARRVLFILK